MAMMVSTTTAFLRCRRPVVVVVGGGFLPFPPKQQQWFSSSSSSGRNTYPGSNYSGRGTSQQQQQQQQQERQGYPRRVPTPKTILHNRRPSGYSRVGGGGGGGGPSSSSSPSLSKSFGWRHNLVSVFPGDFGDNRDLREGAERAWKDSYQRPEQTLEADVADRRDEAQKVRDYVRTQEAEAAALKEKRRQRALNPKRWVTRLDDRGCAYGRGARKRAHARVWIQPGLGEITVNRQDYADYFVRETLREDILKPFVITETLGFFDVTATVAGGGLSGQAGAIRLGIARCLNNYNPDLYRPPLKFQKLLTRDSRVVESKKVGKVKARKAPQWSKR